MFYFVCGKCEDTAGLRIGTSLNRSEDDLMWYVVGCRNRAGNDKQHSSLGLVVH